MKKPIYALLILIMLVLSACSGQAQAPQANTSQAAAPAAEQSSPAESDATPVASAPQDSGTNGVLNTDFENAESLGSQILLGIIKLDGTELALTKEQATTMLPLWDEYLTLSQKMMPSGSKSEQTKDSSTPAAPTENTEAKAQTDALITKIQTVFTADQINAIAEMKISSDIAQTIMKEKGITMGGSQQGGGNPPDAAPPADGQKPADGQQPSAGGQQAPGNNQDASTQNDGSQTAKNGQIPSRPGGRIISPGLLSAVIKILETTSGLKSTSTVISAGLSPAEGNPGAPGVPNNFSSTDIKYGSVYQQTGGTESKTDETINASETDQSAVYVSEGGKLTLSKSTITTSGDTSSQDNSSFYGLNAAVLAAGGSSIDFSDSTVKTTGLGANGVFATGTGSTVNLTNIVIDATADGGHGVMATNGGVLTLKDVDITTAGKNSGALATDRGSGTITAEGGTIFTTGVDSPAIYSTGIISVTDGILSASGAESAVIEGANKIILINSTLTSSLENKWGVMIYQSMSGDAEGTQGTFTMSGGELANTAKTGPLFYVTNSTGVMNLTGVILTANSGELIKAGADRWGTKGSNGGNVILTADGQSLTGSVTADALSSVSLSLQNGSAYKGAINSEKTAKQIDLVLDASSEWNVTADSYLTSLKNPAGINGTTITNINGNGFTVYYDSTANPDLGGKTYTLNEGGSLTPIS